MHISKLCRDLKKNFAFKVSFPLVIFHIIEVAMHFTCNTCGLAFHDAENQREHMKGDWHRYNLKRRVADLPPVDEQTFNSKVSVLNPKESTDTTKIRGRKGGKNEEDVQKTITKKELRRKEKEAALLEKKMALLEIARKRMSESQQPNNETVEERKPASQEYVILDKDISSSEQSAKSTIEEDSLTEEQLLEEKVKNRVEIKPEECLFCGKVFPDQKEAISHMFHSHGLYIPERDYLVDEAGLIYYLAEKIGFGNVCLCCNFQGRSLESVRNHMLAKRHCRLPYESEDEQLEISEFYDFTSSYKPKEKIVVVDGVAGNSIDAGDWEDVEGEENSDEEEAPKEVSYVVGSDLVLPTGLIVGHRSLQRYYKQNLPVERVLKEGEGTVIAADARHLSVTYDKKLAQEQKRVWTKQQKDAYRDDRRSAKFINNQPHFRDELLQ
ncbi:BA75_01524T0 [Komagataella pastoris]|uniref:BA75_01524T0 n=1 Tax=Komagataella pastoris TaxID=4922 RepID=A0A1B2J957_PICPA|nr:BA75_01524T0 [Komagataella pastoris]